MRSGRIGAARSALLAMAMQMWGDRPPGAPQTRGSKRMYGTHKGARRGRHILPGVNGRNLSCKSCLSRRSRYFGDCLNNTSIPVHCKRIGDSPSRGQIDPIHLNSYESIASDKSWHHWWGFYRAGAHGGLASLGGAGLCRRWFEIG